MKKFILPLTVAVLAAGMQLTSFDTKVSSEKRVAVKRSFLDVGAFTCSIGLCEAYGPVTGHTITSVTTPDGNTYDATGTYVVNGDQGTMNVTFTITSTGQVVHYNGRYFV
jgi:hypothetical protein